MLCVRVCVFSTSLCMYCTRCSRYKYGNDAYSYAPCILACSKTSSVSTPWCTGCGWETLASCTFTRTVSQRTNVLSCNMECYMYRCRMRTRGRTLWLGQQSVLVNGPWVVRMNTQSPDTRLRHCLTAHNTSTIKRRRACACNRRRGWH